MFFSKEDGYLYDVNGLIVLRGCSNDNQMLCIIKLKSLAVYVARKM